MFVAMVTGSVVAGPARQFGEQVGEVAPRAPGDVKDRERI